MLIGAAAIVPFLIARLSATGPAETVVQALGWRGLFSALAAASAAVALLILLVVPDRKTPTQAADAGTGIGFLAIYLDRRFLRIAPLAALGVGTSFSLQGLWAAPWLADATGLDRPTVVRHLTLMAAVLAASAVAASWAHVLQNVPRRASSISSSWQGLRDPAC